MRQALKLREVKFPLPFVSSYLSWLHLSLQTKSSYFIEETVMRADSPLHTRHFSLSVPTLLTPESYFPYKDNKAMMIRKGYAVQVSGKDCTDRSNKKTDGCSAAWWQVRHV